jgi:uncharacterized membrane protein YesL
MDKYGWKDFFRDATDLILAGILFLTAGVLGVFLTVGAALKALFAVAFAVMNHQKAVRVTADFWKAFKDGFFHSTLVWILALGIGTGCFFVMRFALDQGNPWVAASGIVTAVLTLIFLLYFYSLSAVFRASSFRQMAKNAVLMAARHPGSTLLLLGGLAVPVLLFGLWYGTILISPALFAAIEAWHLNRLFRPYREVFEPPETGI